MTLRDIIATALGIDPARVTPEVARARLGCVAAPGDAATPSLDWPVVALDDEEAEPVSRPCGMDGTIYVRGPIVPQALAQYLRSCGAEATSAADFATDMASNLGDVVVNINCPGGNVWQAAEMMALVNERRRQGATVTTEVHGLAASAAALLFLTGSERAMDEFAMLMVHRASIGILLYGTAPDVRREVATVLAQLDLFDSRQSELIQRISSLDRDEVERMLTAETWYSATQAVDLGLATRLLAAEPPAEQEEEPAGRQPEALAGLHDERLLATVMHDLLQLHS